MKPDKLDEAIHTLKMLQNGLKYIATQDYLDGLQVAVETLEELKGGRK